MNKYEFKDLVKVDMRNLINEHFQYGMIMDGVLYPNSKEETAAFFVNSDYMTLIYFCQTDDYCGYMKQKISLYWESRQYGDTEAHFICPECGKKCFVLYNSGLSFMCRKCTKAYQSECLTDKERTARIECKLADGTIMDTVWI